MAELFAYTDGACSGNPGPGGWGVLLIAREGSRVVRERELSGGEMQRTAIDAGSDGEGAVHPLLEGAIARF